MIKSFACKETSKLFDGNSSRKFPGDIQRIARRKLFHIAVITNLNDLRVPPGNRLEKLSGRRKIQYSIRINSRWRICFRFESSNAHEVEIVDYH